MDSKTLFAGAAFGLVLASGYWLSHAGKPYQQVVLAVHKLISLGTLVYLIVSVINFRKIAPVSTALLVASGIGIIGFVALIASGGIISAARTTPPAIVTRVHAIAPYVAILSSVAGLFLMRFAR